MAMLSVLADPIPCFTIDLAKPPRERYLEVAREFTPYLQLLSVLAKDGLSRHIPSKWLQYIVKRLSKFLLRRVHDADETEEIKGISEEAGVPLCLLIALNSLLESTAGTTSGTAPVSSHRQRRATGDRPSQRLLHVRTLDIGAEELQDLLVVLEFVDSSSDTPRHIIAQSITYAGYVGSLTAVREGLSVSLNYRRYECSKPRLYWHQLMVLLGRRRSVGSMIRSLMLRPSQTNNNNSNNSNKGKARDESNPFAQLVEQTLKLSMAPSVPCYVLLCNGQGTAVIVKEHGTSSIHFTKDAIIQRNQDLQRDRSNTLHFHTKTRHHPVENITSSPTVGRSKGARARTVARLDAYDQFRFATEWLEFQDSLRPVESNDTTALQASLSKWPTFNFRTNFACILDPEAGRIRWLVRGPME